jgi:alpha/beta superfamily hydrolase
MTNKVVYMLARTLVQQGIPALRFNFRGVGKSAGEYDQGRGETEDALAALDWLKQRWPGAKQWLGGFSFGAYVALAAASRRNIAALITVAPPVERFAIKTLELPQCPWLLIQGEADEVVDPTAVLDWASRLQNPPTIETLPETGHYFHGKLNMLRNILIDALPSLHDN